MLLKLARYFLLGLVLLLVFFGSAMLSMRFAIHGQEVRVPKLTGLTPVDAERAANGQGLVMSVETKFYSSSVPQGRIVAQAPAAETRVRRGWKVRVAESLGPQIAAVPSFLGQSEHAAGVNISRRGLEVESVAFMHLPGASPATVIAQSPPPNSRDVASPKVGLIFSAAENEQFFVMPNFVGKSLGDARDAIDAAGFELGKVREVSTDEREAGSSSSRSQVIIRQRPAAGHKVVPGTTIDLDVTR
jgi:eukaryotic-like serine/threonine-protein kinase